MKRWFSFLVLSVLTFVIGFTGFWINNKVAGIFAYNPIVPAQRLGYGEPPYDTRIKNLSFEKPIKLEFQRYTDEKPPFISAVFKITNDTGTPLYYAYYDRNGNCSAYLRVGRALYNGIVCSCGTGVETQTLLPGQSAIFDSSQLLGLPYAFCSQKTSVQIGFGLSEEPDGQEKIVWSKPISLPQKYLRFKEDFLCQKRYVEVK